VSTFKEIEAVTTMNLKSIPQRLGSSWVVVAGMAGVVVVLVSVFGMTRSLAENLLATGRPDRAIVLRGGANVELSSSLSIEATRTIKNAPGIARTPDGYVAATADMVTSADFLRREDGRRAGLVVRGIEPAAFAMRPEIKLVEGRWFTPGLREVIAGRSARAEFRGLEVGDEIALRNGRWAVVGVYVSNDSYESGVLADASTLISAYQQGVSSLTARLESADAFNDFKTALTTNPELNVEVLREVEYFDRQSQNASNLVNIVSKLVAGLMAVGALFAALNTMHAAVSGRIVEIATLRAIGFAPTGVVASVLAESVFLAFLGALLGGALSWLVFSGYTVSIGSVGGSTESLVFQVNVTPELVGLGIVWACILGFVGGLIPALRAATLPVATGLRGV
jgi:putative ABC transport system permease protein